MANNAREPISTDELKRLGEALKDDKFRQLLLEYAEEIRDPQNRQRYENELSILERERGVEITFIHPEAGYVIKTTADDSIKAFINICKNKNVEKPSCSKSNTRSGLDWSVPYFLSPPREDVDRSGRKCRIYDVIFHSDTIYMAQRNARFRKMIEDTALEGIQQQFSVWLDRKNLHFPKLKYKGQPFPTVLRKPICDESVSELSQKLEKTDMNEPEPEKSEDADLKNEEMVQVTIPKCSVRYRSNIGMESCTVIAQQSANIRPDEIIIEIELPLIDTAAGVNLDINQQKLTLACSCAVNYALELSLPFPVDDSKGKAQFDQSKRTLVVTLPICPFVATETSAEEQQECPDDFKPGTPSPTKENPLVSHHCMIGNLCLQSHAYDLPRFDVNQTDETVTFLLHVLGVHTDSIDAQICDCGFGFQVVFTSSADTNWYSFCVTSKYKLQLQEPVVDVSETNLVLRLCKNEPIEWMSFDYGCYEAVGDMYIFLNRSSVLEKFEKLGANTKDILNGAVMLENGQVQVTSVTEDNMHFQLQINIPGVLYQSSEADTDGESGDNGLPEIPRKARTSSDSSQEYGPLRSRRGILKYPRNWRSISESSDDLNYCPVVDQLPPSPEEDDFDLMSDDKVPKKNVRFNDNVSKNIFRANSSILGQKKKNQKRAQYKKRAAERSSSQESESHDSAATTTEEESELSSGASEKPKKKRGSRAGKKDSKRYADDVVDILVAESENCQLGDDLSSNTPEQGKRFSPNTPEQGKVFTPNTPVQCKDSLPNIPEQGKEFPLNTLNDTQNEDFSVNILDDGKRNKDFSPDLQGNGNISPDSLPIASGDAFLVTLGMADLTIQGNAQESRNWLDEGSGDFSPDTQDKTRKSPEVQIVRNSDFSPELQGNPVKNENESLFRATGNLNCTNGSQMTAVDAVVNDSNMNGVPLGSSKNSLQVKVRRNDMLLNNCSQVVSNIIIEDLVSDVKVMHKDSNESCGDTSNGEVMVKVDGCADESRSEEMEGTNEDWMPECEKRTCSENAVGLDFRTSYDSVIDLFLPPDNTAFDLD